MRFCLTCRALAPTLPTGSERRDSLTTLPVPRDQSLLVLDRVFHVCAHIPLASNHSIRTDVEPSGMLCSFQITAYEDAELFSLPCFDCANARRTDANPKECPDQTCPLLISEVWSSSYQVTMPHTQTHHHKCKIHTEMQRQAHAHIHTNTYTRAHTCTHLRTQEAQKGKSLFSPLLPSWLPPDLPSSPPTLPQT